MAKRLGETEKWSDPWFRSRSPLAKLWFLYLIDRCDAGGVWEIDLAEADKAMGLSESGIEADSKFWKGLVNHLNEEPKTLSLLDDAEENPVPRLILLKSNHIWITRYVLFAHSHEPNMKNRFFTGAVTAMKKHGIWERWKELWKGRVTIQNEDYVPEQAEATEPPKSFDELLKFAKNKYGGFPEAQLRKFWEAKEKDGWGERWKKSLNHWVKNYHEQPAKRSILDLKSQIKAIDEEIKVEKGKTYTPEGKSIAIPTPEALAKIEELKKKKADINRRIAEGDV